MVARKLFALVGLAAAAGVTPSGWAAVAVVSATPQGPLVGDEQARIQIVFSTPVVPLAQVDAVGQAPPWLEISPPLPARWRWAGTAELVGEPLGPLPFATRYQVTVGTGLRSMGGKSLARPFRFTFETPAPHGVVTAVPPEYVEEAIHSLLAGESFWLDGSEARDHQSVLLVFNQSVDVASVMGLVSVTAQPVTLQKSNFRPELPGLSPPEQAAWERLQVAARGGPPRVLPVVVRPHPSNPERVFFLEPVGGCWPAGVHLQVRVAAGVKSLEGPLEGEESSGQVSTLAPFAPLAVAGPQVAHGQAFDPEQVGLLFSSPVAWRDLAGRLRLRRQGEEPWQRPTVSPEEWVWGEESTSLPLGSLSLAGGSAYEVCLDATAHDAAGQLLGFPACVDFRTGRRTPFAYLVEGAGVVEHSEAPIIPLRTRNVTGLRVAHRRLAPEELCAGPRHRNTFPDARELPLEITPDRLFVAPLDLGAVLGGQPGVVATRVEVVGTAMDSEYDPKVMAELRQPRHAVTQVTSLGLTLKKSRHADGLAWVTRLADGTPVEGAQVAVWNTGGAVVWAGETDASGLVHIGAEALLDNLCLVTARLGSDWAYANLDWHHGHKGWDFNLPVEWAQKPPVVGTVWADRGVVRPGETVHLKAAVRRRRELALELPGGQQLTFVVRDARREEVAVVRAPLDRWGGAELHFKVPAGASLGRWDVLAVEDYDEANRQQRGWMVAGSFRVAEFRRPKMRVEVHPTRSRVVAGDPLEAKVEGSLLAGGGMAGAPLRWTVQGQRTWLRPPKGRWEEFEILPTGFGEDDEPVGGTVLGAGEGTLDPRGQATLRLDAPLSLLGWPLRAELEVEVEDVDRQRAAARTAVEILPGEFFVAVRRPPFFGDAAGAVRAEVVALTPAWQPLDGVPLTVRLVRRHWESVRRREVSGRFVFESRPVDTEVASAKVISRADPVPVELAPAGLGEYALVVEAADRRGNRMVASASLYLVGGGYTPWRLDREHLLELVPERDTVTAGETARVLVKSPWPRATALVTLERAGVVEAQVRELEGSMPVLEIPMRTEHAPNVFVSVVMVRGRFDAPPDPERTDPGRPSYRVGACEIKVPPTARRLAVTVISARKEYRPAQEATAEVVVAGTDGVPRRASVTLWAVDVGVLGLTGYRAPDLMGVFYAQQGIGVTTFDTRAQLIGRRSYGTKSDAPGGGGGDDAAGAEPRRDFRAVAVWRGDLVTDEMGRARVTFRLPDSLTTYRIMAVAMAGLEEFGTGEGEFLVTKPLGLEPALPRFLRPGDEARVAVVVRNRTAAPEEVEVILGLPPAGPVELRGGSTRVAWVAAGGSVEVGFGLRATRPGPAQLRWRAVAQGKELDALEVELPVVLGVPLEKVSTFFALPPPALETVMVPAAEEVYAELGGLSLWVAPSLLGGVAGAVEWLLEFPYGCAEQLASQVLGLTAAQRLRLPLSGLGADEERLLRFLAGAVTQLSACQQADGGFALWPGARGSHPALSAHVLWALSEAAQAGVGADPQVLARAAAYLGRKLRDAEQGGEASQSWMVRVLAAHALAAAGRAQPGFFQELFDRRARSGTTWGKSLLAVAMLTSTPGDPRAGVLVQETRNRLAMEARTARLEEPTPPWAWQVFWLPQVGSAAALLAELRWARGSEVLDRLARGVAEGLARPPWTTQEVAWALQALAAYRQRREGQEGEGEVLALLGNEVLLRANLGARAQRDFAQAQVPMANLLARGGRPAARLPLEVRFSGTGLLHGQLTLASAPRRLDRPPLQQGIGVARWLALPKGGAVDGVVAGTELDLVVEVNAPATRRFVVVEVPLPAGVEPVDPHLATTARLLLSSREAAEDEGWVGRPGFDHVEPKDDRIRLFATTLGPGTSRLVIPCRATTPGRFAFAPARAEEMYAPEVFGTAAAGTFTVTPAGR